MRVRDVLEPVRTLVRKWEGFARTPAGRRTVKGIRYAFIGGVLAVLVYQITEIGWGHLLRSLPDQPAFYAVVLASYLLLPVTEAEIYGRLWKRSSLQCLLVMLRKRVLNVDVVGYSGEVYLMLWAQKRFAIGRERIRGTIKDNLIASAIASLASAAITILFLLAIGFISVSDFIQNPDPYYIVLGSTAALLIVIILIRYQSTVFHLPTRTVALLGATHTGRFLLGYVLTVVQWWIVIPTVSLRTWAAILVVFVVVNRIPLLPSSDLVIAGLGTEVAPLFGVPAAPFVGMLLVRSAAERLLNLAAYTLTSPFDSAEIEGDGQNDAASRNGASDEAPEETVTVADEDSIR